MRKIQTLLTDKYQKNLFKPLKEQEFQKDVKEQEMQLLMVYSDIKYHEIKGFGGAFTQSSAINFYQMNESCQEEILESYFGESGLKYNYGRTHIASCDFSNGHFGYTQKEDLSDFTIECDQDLLIPFIKKCESFANKEIHLMSSPWSPPAFMKDSKGLLFGGKLLPEYYQAYADYFVKYIQAYKNEGIVVEMVSVQNEPKAVQRWESCIYTAEEEKIFIRDYLYPTLQQSGLEEVKIVIWDHNKERTFERARAIMSDEKTRKAVYGVGVHWYSGDHFENLRICKEFFPDKEIIFTEGCVELLAGAPTNLGGNETVVVSESPWEFGERYAHDMIGNFNNGLSTMIDWNLILDSQGGPNHVGNYCSAPIIVDIKEQRVKYQPSFYFIGHFSKFIPEGSRKIAQSCYSKDLEVASFLTPSNEVVVVVLNSTEKEIPFTLKDVMTQEVSDFTALKKSIMTLVYQAK